MKTLKQIKEEIANVSAGIGVRGFGDVSGTPKIGDETHENPHIVRVTQGAEENNALVNQYIKNNTDGLYTFSDEGWWKDKFEIKKYTRKNTQLKEEGVTTDVGPGMGDNESKEVFPGKTKKNKPVWPMFRRLPLQLEDIGGIAGTVGGTSVGTGYIAGAGVPLEGKPSNWSEPGISPRNQKKKKKKVDDPRMFGMLRRKSFKQFLEEK